MMRPGMFIVLVILFTALVLPGCETARRPDRSLTVQLQPVPAAPATIRHQAVVARYIWLPWGIDWGMHRKHLGEHTTDNAGRAILHRIDPERDLLRIETPGYLSVTVGAGGCDKPFTAAVDHTADTDRTPQAQPQPVGVSSDGLITIHLIADPSE